MSIKIGVVVPVLCQFQMALEALHSVQSSHDWQPFIIDNWSGHNRGVAASWNEGCRQAIAARCTHILIINDDVVLSPWVADALVDMMESSPQIAVVSGVQVGFPGAPPDRDFGGTRDAIRQVPRLEAVQVTDHPEFCCFMVTPGTLEHVGWFDEHFFPAYFEDNDYLYRTNLSGRLAQSASAAPHLHYSQSSMSGAAQGSFGVNQSYYLRKWGGPPWGEQYKQPFGDPGKTWRDT